METATSSGNASKEEMIERARALAPTFRERAAAAESARRISAESAGELLAAGVARMLVPKRLGGSELGLDTFFEVVREIGRADASHAWCASLMAHVPQMLLQFGEDAQQAIWRDGPDIPTAGSVMPFATVVAVDGGYRVSGNAPFASGVLHSTWVFVGGFLPEDEDGPPAAAMFLVAPGDYEVSETWFTSGMRATGSNTIVTDGAFVPSSHVLRISDLRESTGPGAALSPHGIYRLPFVTYAPLALATPMLGAAQGAYDDFVAWATDKRLPGGARLAEAPSLQTAIGKISGDLAAAELLLRTIVDGSTQPADMAYRRACMRNASRAADLIVEAVDAIVNLGGTSSFAESNPAQRAWRDIHFGAAHVSLQTEINYAHWGRGELGIDKPPTLQIY